MKGINIPENIKKKTHTAHLTQWLESSDMECWGIVLETFFLFLKFHESITTTLDQVASSEKCGLFTVYHILPIGKLLIIWTK